jgi:phosphoribosylformylglycinamidine cyclo-ligase
MPEEFTYRDAGVDIDAMNRALESIKESVHRTFTPAVLSQMGSFGGMLALDVSGYRQPVLVASIDGVGTKVRVARMMNQYRVLGHDLVAHGVNDLLVQAAKPLFFLDYLAMSKLEPQVLQEVVEGASELCQQLGIVLLGGETAEMPDVYLPGEVDVAGCIVGIAEFQQIPTPSRVEVGDAVIGDCFQRAAHERLHAGAARVFRDCEHALGRAAARSRHDAGRGVVAAAPPVPERDSAPAGGRCGARDGAHHGRGLL